MKESLEANWDHAYPDSDGELLWPEKPVPFVSLAEQYFLPEGMIVDLPCGDGKNVFELAKLGPVLACDTSFRALSICENRRRLRKFQNIITIRADIFSLPFLDGSIASIFCCDLLGHLPNPELALTELYRVCSSTGKIIVTFFSTKDSALEDSRMELIECESFLFRGKWFFRFYDETSVRNLVQKIGFRILSINEFSWIEGPHPGYREYEHSHTSWALVITK